MNNTLSDKEAYYEKMVSVSLKIGFIALLFMLAYVILKPFFVMVLWAIIIAVGIYPIFEKLVSVLGKRAKLASVLLTVTILTVIIVPSVLLVDSTIESIQNIATKYQEGTLYVPPPGDNVAEWPLVGKPIYETWKLASTNLEAALTTLEPQIKEHGSKVVDAIAGIGGTIFLQTRSFPPSWAAIWAVTTSRPRCSTC